MKIYLDSGNIEEITKWIPYIDGITTNPSILKKDGYTIEDIIEVTKGKLEISLEVVFPYLEEARRLSKISNTAIKIPLLNTDGSNNLKVIRTLSEEGIWVNCTALFSLGQSILAAKAGSKYVSIFAGRIEDEGGSANSIIEQVAMYLDSENFETFIIAGSIRSISQIEGCLKSGADIITLPPSLLDKMLQHRYSIETVKQFEEDAKFLNFK